MKKLLIMLIVLIACVACLSSCQLINSLFPCKHKETVKDAAVAATCTEAGLTEGSHCAKCGEIVAAQEAVPALGHTEVVDAAVAATCDKDGLTEGSHCSVCNVTVVAQEVVPAAHAYGDWIDATASDCIFGGEQTRICSVCEYVDVQVLDALEHSFVQDEETKLFYCENCNARIYAGHLYAVIEQSMTWYDAYTLCESIGGHLATITNEYEQAIITNMMTSATAPIYWIGGIKTNDQWHWITGEEFVYTNWYPRMPDNSAKIEWFLNIYSSSAFGHTVGTWNDLDANKTQHADENYKTSGVLCEWELDIVESEHFFTEWEIITEANCFVDGEKYRFCTHCGLEETEVIPQVKHNFVSDEASGATLCEYCSAALYDGHIYKIFNVGLSWFEAYTYCQELGGHLVTITSQEEQAFVETYMESQSFSAEAWIGSYNDGIEWHWITGEAFEYTNWEETQPDCYEGYEYLGSINHVYTKWNDRHPHEKYGFICEWDAE